MARPKVWYRQSHKAWYARIDKKQVHLVKGPKNRQTYNLAREAYKKIRHETAPKHGVSWVVDEYLDHVRLNYSKASHRFKESFVSGFALVFGDRMLKDITQNDVDRWCVSKGWNQTTRSMAITTLKNLCIWAKKQGYLRRNPLRGMKQPKTLSRGGKERCPTDQEYKRMLRFAPDKATRLLIIALNDSGCRPGEIAKLEAKDYDADVHAWNVHGKTGARTVYLTHRLEAITVMLASKRPTGCLFRQGCKRPWTPRRLEKFVQLAREGASIGKQLTPYSFRHRYIRSALLKGVPTKVVATLVGHKSCKMIDQHYGDVTGAHEDLRAWVEKFRGEEKGEEK